MEEVAWGGCAVTFLGRSWLTQLGARGWGPKTSGGPFQLDYAMILWSQDHVFVPLTTGDMACNEEEGLSFLAKEISTVQEIS